MKDDVPSRTSLFVARVILLLGGDAYGRSLLPPGCFETQLQFLQAANLIVFPYWLTCNPIFSKLVRWFVRFLTRVPFLEGFGFRKKWIEEHVRKNLTTTAASTTAVTVTQVLVIAAGYDMLAWRLAGEYPKLQIYELDHPATSNVKRKGLEKMGVIPPNLHLIQADLTKTRLEDVLSGTTITDNHGAVRPRYDKNAKTIVIMEGLLFYLEADHVKELFHSVSNVVGTDSIVAFDFFGWNKRLQCVDMGPGSLTGLAYLKSIGEPMLWGIDPQNLEAFFAPTDWQLYTEIGEMGFEKLAAAKKNKM